MCSKILTTPALAYRIADSESKREEEEVVVVVMPGARRLQTKSLDNSQTLQTFDGFALRCEKACAVGLLLSEH
jgi:hypothetical protein